jgi:hypothetical protein
VFDDFDDGAGFAVNIVDVLGARFSGDGFYYIVDLGQPCFVQLF